MTANADGPICEVCDEQRAEGSFAPAANPTPVCRGCAECAVLDGLMASRDFTWWSAPSALGNGESAN